MAYCVAYHEQFVNGDVRGRAYQCFLTISDRGGRTLTAGRPAGAFLALAARKHGEPRAAVNKLRDMATGGEMAAPRTLVNQADMLPHLPAPQPNPSPNYTQAHMSQAEIKGR